MWIKWMPLRYLLAYIFFIFAPPVILFFGTAFALISAPCYACLISWEITRRGC